MSGRVFVVLIKRVHVWVPVGRVQTRWHHSFVFIKRTRRRGWQKRGGDTQDVTDGSFSLSTKVFHSHHLFWLFFASGFCSEDEDDEETGSAPARPYCSLCCCRTRWASRPVYFYNNGFFSSRYLSVQNISRWSASVCVLFALFIDQKAECSVVPVVSNREVFGHVWSPLRQLCGSMWGGFYQRSEVHLRLQLPAAQRVLPGLPCYLHHR